MLEAQEKSNNSASEDGFTLADVFVSGSVSFGSLTDNNNNTNSNQFTFSPKIGYFVDDNIAIGLDLGYRSNKNERRVPLTNAIIKAKETILSAGAFARYYIAPENQFSLFGELGIGYSSRQFEEGIIEDPKRNGFYLGFSPGVNYFVSHHFALEASVGLLRYDTVKFDVDNSESVNTFNIGLDFTNINLGVVYRF